MNWDANLAAIIKHTDANLQQQFRQFDERSFDSLGLFPSSSVEYATAAFSGHSSAPPPPPTDSTNFASAFLRDTTATLRPPPPTSFAQHFREQQDRKKQHYTSPSDDSTSENDNDQPQYVPPRSHTRRSRHSANQGGLGAQMYASPTYDMAQMMEQVRLSLKLEVDARAAIAERQLSALLHLCKTSSEELDRLRVEVCATDRQLHTLDQVQSKMRQELTTQKDISFHLQSMCGKDESWRMQAENQLLEMRQLVAAIREQGNAVQMQVQDKLSRQELLVQFNAAIEPIKAQFQATLQHQAHQLAEMTRTSSSSSLLLDALVQKVNRVQSDELVVLRTDLQALKVHVSRMGAMDANRGMEDHDEGDHDDHEDSPPSRKTGRRTRAKEAVCAQERERLQAEREQEQRQRQRDDVLKKEIVEVVLPNVIVPLIKSELDNNIKPQLADVQNLVGKDVGNLKQEIQSLTRTVQDNWTSCQRQTETSVASLEAVIKQSGQQVRGELTTQIREVRERQDQQGSQLTNQLTSIVDTRVAACQAKLNDVVKALEIEQKDRKAADDATLEELRRVRHVSEEQFHAMKYEQRTKATTFGDEWNQKLRELERKWGDNMEAMTKQTTLQAEASWTKSKIDVDARLDRLEVCAKTTTGLVDKVEKAVASVSEELSTLAAKLREALEKEDDLPKLTRRGSATVAATLADETTQSQLASIDTLLQKMMLQMQLQMQQHQQLAMAQSSAAATVSSSMYAPPYWPSIVHSPPGGPTIPAPTTASAMPPIALVPPSPPVPQPKEVASKSREEPVTTANAVDTLSTQSILDTSKLSVCEEPMVAKIVAKTVELRPDPQLDDIISRAVAEELASPIKSSTVRQALSTPYVPSDVAKPLEASNSSPDSRPSSMPAVKPTSDSTTQLLAGSPSEPVATIDPATKAQQSLASSVKGATSEAEMAKQRIEARRKQEQELRQQPTSASKDETLPPQPLTRASSTSSLLATDKPTQSDSTAPTPALARSHSVSNFSPPTPSPASPSMKLPTTSTSTMTTKPPPPSPASTMYGAVSSPISWAPTAAIESKIPTTPSLAPSSVNDLKKTPMKPPTAPATPPPAAPSQPITHVLCDQCRLPVRSDLLTEHMQRQCIKRTIACTKCTTKYPWHEVDTHQRSCQGITTASSIPPPPPRPVTQPTMSLPTSTAATKPTDSVPDTTTTQLKKCRHCSADVASADLFDHELKCDQMLKQCPHCLRRQKVSELQDHIENCDCRLVSCPNDCGGKFLQRGLDKHLTTRCPKRSATGATSTSSPTIPSSSMSSVSLSTTGPVTAPPPPPQASKSTSLSASTPAPTKTDEVKTEKVECKFCDEEFASREIDAHENSCDWKPKRCQHCNMVIISRDLVRHESTCKTSTKICPHCNETMAQSALPTHMTRCSKRPIKCIRCCQLFPADSIVAHSSSCKFIPSSASATPTPTASTPSLAVSASASAKIPPPPPYPPTITTTAIPKPATSTVDESAADRIARRNLALSQLTNQAIAAPGSSISTTTNVLSTALQAQSLVTSRPEVDDDDQAIDDEEDDDEDEDEEEDEDEGQLTLAQVVAEWSVENVCLWLHEDVGVPDVVPRFQHRRCNGEMLLELTESDLINDYGIKNRIHRERILSAIDAIKTSDDFSDEEEENDEAEEEDVEEEEIASVARAPHQRASMNDASAARDLLRRNSLPSPQHSPLRMVGTPLSSSTALPSSSAMLRRINSALNVEFPSATSR